MKEKIENRGEEGRKEARKLGSKEGRNERTKEGRRKKKDRKEGK